MSYEDDETRVKDQLAQISGTSADDWYLVFKARYGMAVCFEQIAALRGRGEVITQAFTCLTAVAPILSGGLSPRYADINESTLMIDPDLISLTPATRAVVMQHTFGMMCTVPSRALANKVLEASAVLVEDSAHCVGQMTKDSDGRPMADLSIHSFGVEKVLPTRFGGAVYVNPAMRDQELRKQITRALSDLPVVSNRVSLVSRGYAVENAVLNRTPGSLGNRAKAALAAQNLFEAPISPSEAAGHLPYRPTRPSAWMLRDITKHLEEIDSIRRTRCEATKRYRKIFAQSNVMLPRELSDNDALVRFPVFAASAGASERAIEAVNSAGYFAGHWYRPLLFPGVNGDEFGFDPQGNDLPVTRSMAARVLNFQTTNAPHVCAEIARIAVDSLDQRPAQHTEVGNDDFVPVFLGTGLGVYALARSMHEEYGVRSLALGRARLNETDASAIIEVRAYASFDDPDFIIETVTALGNEFQGKKVLLIPAIEFYTNVISRHRDELGDRFLIPLPASDLVEKLIDKRSFYETCVDIGLPTPETQFVSRVDFEGGWDAEQACFQLPVIIKPADTDTYQRIPFPGRKKVYRADTVQEVNDVFRLVYGSGYAGDLVIQEYLRGGEEVMRVANTYSDHKGKTRFIAIGQIILTDVNPSRVGNSNAISAAKDPVMAEKLRQFLDALGYAGLANFDLMYDAAAGEYKVLEVNLRAGASNFYTVGANGNLAKYIVDDLVYGRELPFLEAEEGALWINVPSLVLTLFAPKSTRAQLQRARSEGTIHTLAYPADRSARRFIKRAKESLKRSTDYILYNARRLNR